MMILLLLFVCVQAYTPFLTYTSSGQFNTISNYIKEVGGGDRRPSSRLRCFQYIPNSYTADAPAYSIFNWSEQWASITLPPHSSDCKAVTQDDTLFIIQNVSDTYCVLGNNEPVEICFKDQQSGIPMPTSIGGHAYGCDGMATNCNFRVDISIQMENINGTCSTFDAKVASPSETGNYFVGTSSNGMIASATLPPSTK